MAYTCVAVQAIRKLLETEFPNLKRVETSSLHKGVAGARHNFLPAPGNTNKLDILAQVSHLLHWLAPTSLLELQ